MPGSYCARICCLVTLLPFGVGPLAAQQPQQTQVDAKQNVFRGFFHDEYHMWTSPFRGSTYDSSFTKRYGVPFLAISGALIATDTRTAELLPNSEDQALWSGRVSQIGAPYTLAGLSGAVYLLGKAKGNRHAQETGLLALAAVGHSQLIVFGLKQAMQRERPLSKDQDGSFWEGGDSFPSGHAATSFAVATVFAYEYRDHIAAPIAAYSVASLVSASRLGARRHWVSDIFVGASLGFLMGRYLYKQHHDPGLGEGGGQRRSRLIPAVTFGGHGAGLYWSF